MYNFTFNIPTKIHFGKDTISSLSELKAYGSKVLLVYGGGSIKKNGLYDTAMKILKDAGLTMFELSGVEPNPKIETVRKGVEICKNEGIDMVLAIGGGSTIDCSKVVDIPEKNQVMNSLIGSQKLRVPTMIQVMETWDLVLDGSKVKAALPIFDDGLTLSSNRNRDGSFCAVISDMSKNEKWGSTGSSAIWCQLCQY